ncbi:MAG: hypothetical protein WEC59_11765 [Salibacteraceae bacterium]
MSRLFMIRRYLFTSLLALTVTGVLGQSAGQYIAKGNKELKDGFYHSAIGYYKKALQMDTNILEANFQTAEGYRMLRNYKRAEQFYEATSAIDGQDEYPESSHYLGLMQKQQGKYELAKMNFQTFLRIYRSRDDLYRWARAEEMSCEWAIEHQNDTAQFEISTPDSGLNTIHAEMSPFLYNDTTMFFATMRYENDEVKKSNPAFVEIKKAIADSNVWNAAELGLPLSEKGMHVGNLTFSPDTMRFYFTKCPSLSESVIYESRFQDSIWSEPRPMPSPINLEESSNTQPTLAIENGDQYLIFSSDRGRGKGGMDLWYVLMKNGEPTERVRNLGSNINTAGNEITPWYDNSDSTLYFSSDRLAGFGGFDIFKFEARLGSTEIPQNLRTEINSPADDYYFMGRRSDSVAYFASNRISGTKQRGNETCCNDLYKAKMIPPAIIDTIIAPIDSIELAVDTLDTLIALKPINEVENPQNIEELQSLLPISLYFHNDRPNPRTMAITTTQTYPETIEEYLNLQLEYVESVNRSNLSGTEKMRMASALKQLFETDLERSIDKLDKTLNVLLKELSDSTNITLEVQGYASPIANSKYNLNLTYRRIVSMENYLLAYKNGALKPFIESGQLKINKIPFGESKSSSDVSDDYSDELRAIYSPKAAKERRIEILKVEERDE